VPDEEFAQLNIKPSRFHGEWNYGSSGFLVGDFHSFGSMQVRILSRRYSSSRKP
jgi:hypothetical protein